MRSLFVFEQATGEVAITQNIGVDDDVVKKYLRKDGRDANFFERPTCDINRVFVHNGRLRGRPMLLARLSKKKIRGDGEDHTHLMGVPAGALVFVSDGFVERRGITDGTAFPITSRTPGILIISIDAPPHLLQMLKLTVI